MNREEKIAVYASTMAIVNKGKYMSPKGNEVTIDSTKMVEGTKFYGKKAVVDHDSLPKYETEIKVIDSDCLYAAKALVDKGAEKVDRTREP